MLALPGTSLPLMTNVHAGSWLIAFVWTDRITAISSTIFAVWGITSLIQVPHRPALENANFDGATGNRAWPLVIVVIRWPFRTESGSSLSKYFRSCGL